jgi:hypothetical protein
MPETPRRENSFITEQNREVIFGTDVFTLGNTTVQIFGVDHRYNSSEGFRETTRETVRASKIVALEAAPRALGLYSEKSRDELAKILEIFPLEIMLKVPEIAQLAKKKGLKQINSYRQAADLIIEEFSRLKFYSAIEEECLRTGKTIMVTDPDMSVGSIGELIKNNDQEAFIKDSNLEREKIFGTLLFGFLGSGLLAGEKTFKALRNAYKNARVREETEAKEDHNFSSESGATRREFLSGLAGGTMLAGATGIAASTAASHNEARAFYIKDTTNRGRVNNPMGIFLFNYEDYRDVVLAEALERVGSKATEPEILSVFYGEAHRAAAAYYTQHSVERSLKLRAYQNFSKEKFPVPKLRLFKPVNGQWDEVLNSNIT